MLENNKINYYKPKYPACSDLPELWGGMECSITRVGADFTDQLKLSGHYERDSDISMIAGLGIRALRFPILYEKHKPVKEMPVDWTWAEKTFNQLQQNKIIPIAGLVHHGSGPSYTNLLCSRFATGVAGFASEVAEKFPTIEYYTPVNEPLTTARFSGLYGLWFPHHSNDRSFCSILINQLTAVVLSMQEIKKINPAAKLIQTEDLGKSYANKNLQYQVDFENERRWLTFDILCGRLDSDHPLWKYFIDNEIPQSALEFFLENPCPPAIMGLNHYVTSERFLDDDISSYPLSMHGGNGIEKYVDTEAVRVEHNYSCGLPVLMKEVHDRYSLPMAITEVHLNCTREEQLRWFKEVWDSCCTLKKDGLDIKAVTAWSLFGAFGWNTLLTKPECDYEPGVFDLRSSSPRPTALAKMIYAYSSGKQFHYPLLLHPGWWKRKGRFINQIDQYSVIEPLDDINCAPVLIIGNESILKNAFVHICRSRCIPFVLRDMDQMDLSTDNKINTAISVIKPWAIIDISWYAGNKDACAGDMTGYSAALARHCINNNIRLINFSSPYVFNGNQSRPYIESDKPDACNDYGKYIAHLEEVVLKQNPESLIVRTGHLLSVTDAENFIHAVCDTLKQGKVLNVSNVLISSAYVPHLVNNVMDLLIDEEKGILHLTNSGALSWYDLALDICRRSGYSAGLIIPVNDDNINQAPVIESERTWIMPSVTCALNNFFPHHDSNNAAKELYLQNNDR